MKRTFFVAFACTLLVLTVVPPHAGLAQEKEEDISSASLRIDWKEFRKLYDAKAIELIDVRGDVFFESGHIPGARSIPLDQIEEHASDLRRSKKPVVLYCA